MWYYSKTERIKIGVEYGKECLWTVHGAGKLPGSSEPDLAPWIFISFFFLPLDENVSL